MPDMRAAGVKALGRAVLCLVLLTWTSVFAESEEAVMIGCHIRVTLGDVTVRLEAVAGGGDVEALLRQDLRERLSNVRVIVHHENTETHR